MAKKSPATAKAPAKTSAAAPKKGVPAAKKAPARPPGASGRNLGAFAAPGGRQTHPPRPRAPLPVPPDERPAAPRPLAELPATASPAGAPPALPGPSASRQPPAPRELRPAPARNRTRTRRLIEDGLIVVVAVVVAILVRAFVAQAYYIPSGSMLPQLHIDDRVVVSRLAYDLHKPHRGDIVVFKAPPALQTTVHQSSDPIVRWTRDVGAALGLVEDQTVIIKRVIGLPGETVSGRNGHVYVNGDLLYEPYLPRGTVTSTFGPVTVPKGDLWVMGDNRGDSYDSRFFGPIPEHTVIGRAVWKVWPPWRASFL